MSTRKTIRAQMRQTQSGMTLIELIIACSILLILAGAALPIARRNIRYQQEADLRRCLQEMKDSIDRYKDAADKKVRFLRAIPTDPMTKQKDWGKRCVSDDPDSTSWCGKNVFDVYSNSRETGTDG